MCQFAQTPRVTNIQLKPLAVKCVTLVNMNMSDVAATGLPAEVNAEDDLAPG